MTFDLDAFLNIILPYAVSGAALALASFHVKNATSTANDCGALVRDALNAMHSSNKSLVAALAASAPVLVSDTAKVVGDVVPGAAPLVAALTAAPVAAGAISGISATVTAVEKDTKAGDMVSAVQATATELTSLSGAAAKAL